MISLNLLFCLVTALSASALACSTPLTLGLVTFLIMLVVAGIVALCTASWFSLILVLVQLGGLLVMFAYFLAICPNQVIDTVGPLGVGGFTFFGLMYFFENVGVTPSYVGVSPMSVFFVGDGPMLGLLAIVLLMGLLFAVKIARVYRGPLRPFSVDKGRFG